MRFRAIRPLDNQGLGYISPSARLAFSTDATAVSFDVVFNGVVDGNTVLDYDGVFAPFYADILVDGVLAGSARGDVTNKGAVSATATASGLSTGTKIVELIWPTMRPMDLIAVRVSGTSVTAVATAPRRIVCAGDSITMGLAINHPSDGWPFKVSRALNLELVNLGYAGRFTVAGDGTRDGAIGASVSTYLTGFNDYQSGQTAGGLDRFSAAIDTYIADWFAASQTAGAWLVMISPLFTIYVPPSEIFSLQSFRDTIRNRCEVYLAAHPTARIRYVDGLTLMTNNADRLFDAIHPNAAGAAEIAERLTPTLRALL